MGIHVEVHKMLDDAIAKMKAAAVEAGRWERLESHAKTVHMVVDEIPVADAAPSPVAAPAAPAI